jgi:hypothetical protein
MNAGNNGGPRGCRLPLKGKKIEGRKIDRCGVHFSATDLFALEQQRNEMSARCWCEA